MDYTKVATALYAAGHGEAADAAMDAGINHYASLLTRMYNDTPHFDKATVIVVAERMCRFVRSADTNIDRKASILDDEIGNELDASFAAIGFAVKKEEST